MKAFAVILASLLALTSGRAEILLFGWRELQETSTDLKRYQFELAPRAMAEIVNTKVTNDKIPGSLTDTVRALPRKEKWIDCIVVRGIVKRYEKEDITLFEELPYGAPLKIVAGFIEIDRTTSLVRVALKVEQDGKRGDFRGNGVYPIGGKPTKMPEPAPDGVARP